jgi:AAA+ ATPase superfamily predicted ATPase
MMDFVNRREELAFLERCHAAAGFQFVPIYGRRRVGKTRLVREFIRDKRALYFMADSVTEGEQLRNLGREVGEFFSDTFLAETGFQTGTSSSATCVKRPAPSGWWWPSTNSPIW